MLFATDTSNGCKGSDVFPVAENRLYALIGATDDFTINCTDGTVPLHVPILSDPTHLLFEWTLPGGTKTAPSPNSTIIATLIPKFL